MARQQGGASALQQTTSCAQQALPPVRLRPIAVPRVWGGHRLKPLFGVVDPQPIGEYWVVCAHPSGSSVVADGPLAGLSLTDLTERHPEAYLGSSLQPRFPLLVKFLEAAAHLSVQVHPDDDYAQRHAGDYGKTECWYVLDCPPGGRVVYGHSFTSAQQLRLAARTGQVKQRLQELAIAPGDTVYVPSGTLHALLAGTTVIEVQETSDITYRVYDWDRLDAAGRSRPLHVQEASNVTRFGATGGVDDTPIVAPVTVFDAGGAALYRLRQSRYFTLDLLRSTTGSAQLTSGCAGNPDVLVVVQGIGRLSWPGGELMLHPSDAVIVPGTLNAYTLTPSDGQAPVLRSASAGGGGAMTSDAGNELRLLRISYGPGGDPYELTV